MDASLKFEETALEKLHHNFLRLKESEWQLVMLSGLVISFAMRESHNKKMYDKRYCNLQKDEEKVLKLQACKYLENLALIPLHRRRAIPKLCELDLSYGTLSHSAIEELLTWCPHFTRLSLNGCVNMHELDWRFEAGNSSSDSEPHRKQNQSDLRDYQINVEGSPNRSLQHLNRVGCANIKKVAIPASTRCMSLSSLNLSLSANIQEVNLACFNLTTLNLSNCTALEILQLDFPRLTSFLLQVSSTSIAKLRLMSPVLYPIYSSF